MEFLMSAPVELTEVKNLSSSARVRRQSFVKLILLMVIPLFSSHDTFMEKLP